MAVGRTNDPWYPGKTDQRFGRVWHVTFDDGDQAWLAPDRIRPTSRSAEAGRASWASGPTARGTRA